MTSLRIIQPAQAVRTELGFLMGTLPALARCRCGFTVELPGTCEGCGRPFSPFGQEIVDYEEELLPEAA